MPSKSQIDQILNSLGGGHQAHKLVASGMDPGVLRPFIDDDGRNKMTLFNGYDGKGKKTYRTITTNTPALITRQQWLEIDKYVKWQAKQRLRFWGDLRAAVPRDDANGWNKLSIQRWMATGEADAIVSMDPIRKSERSRPIMDSTSIPLPVTHSDASWSSRDLAVSQNQGGMDLRSTGLGLAARKVGEVIEQWALGTSASYTFANGTAYGALNLPQRNLYTMTDPEGGGWTPVTTVNEMLRIVKLLEDLFYYGPYTVYYSNAWGPFLNQDYSTQYPGVTLIDRLLKHPKLTAFKNVDYLPDFTMLIMQLTEDVVEAYSGMDLQTVMWEEQGGFEIMLKVLCLYVPMFAFDYNQHTGYVVASAGTPTTTTSTSSTTTTST